MMCSRVWGQGTVQLGYGRFFWTLNLGYVTPDDDKTMPETQLINHWNRHKWRGSHKLSGKSSVDMGQWLPGQILTNMKG